MTSVAEKSNGSFGFVFEDGLPFGHEVSAAIASGANGPELASEVAKVQDAIRDFTSDSGNRHIRNEIDHNFASSGVSRFVSPNRRIRGSVMGWLAKADPTELQAFCVANVAENQQRQEDLDDAEQLLRTDALMRADRLRRVGFLPVQASTVYDQALAALRPSQAIDFFEAGAIGGRGYYSPERRQVAHFVPYHYAGFMPSSTMYATNFHEDTHAAAYLAGGGFMQGDADGGKHRLIEEVAVSYATQVSAQGATGPEVIDPAERNDRLAGSYVPERIFFSLAAQLGRTPLDINALPEAFYLPQGVSDSARSYIFSRLNASIRSYLPKYKESGLGGFSNDYEVAFEQGTRATWVDRQVREMRKRLEH